MTSLSGETATIPTSSTTAESPFPQFDIVSDYSDHYYANETDKNQYRVVPLTPSRHKKIMQEWNLLRDLPETIYVRAYETRVDLLRVAIVGTNGTPYRNGLFFFDIAFPPDYPFSAPLVHYHSFGYTISPVISMYGGICVSLLNTRFSLFNMSRKEERWDCKQSTVFQVLISIQALVLKEQGLWYEDQQTFITNCKTMIRVLGAPPKHFEPLVKQHFNDRAKSIVRDCDAFRAGAGGAGVFDRFRLLGLSKDMNKIYGSLVRGLVANGASIPRVLHRLIQEENDAQRKQEEGGIGNKLAKLWLTLTNE